jgi:hypothetical protein
MPSRDYTYKELVDLARMCWRQAQYGAAAPDVAAELRRMAHEYQQEAAKLAHGKLPALEDDDPSRERSR